MKGLEMQLLTKKCPQCNSQKLKVHTKYSTKNNGDRNLFKCKDCSKVFSETKNTFMEGLRTPASKIWKIIEARTEGLGLNAASRVFEISENTIVSLEKRFANLYRVLFVYTLVHSFLQLFIEGDEVYTKINKNLPPDQSSGWTILLIDRASRFIFELSCGKKDRRLFMKVIKTLKKIVNRTKDITLITDGERRYGNMLFEVCYEMIRNGKRGRPKKTLAEGVKVRVKNKGSQSHKRGPKRPKYQSPWNEHPETIQNINNTDIHANHAEAFFSSLRRRCAPFRRKTNTYAKNKKGLQRILDAYWVVHNFIRVHFTTKEVPAVALGVIDRRLSAMEIMLIQML